MQFKHPELLWGLLFLIIPIIIHLFRLRKFKRTAFTNVAMLQKAVSESRKSSSIKKWLLLAARLGLISCIVLAFAQPFLANEHAVKPEETVIYLDNSFSMEGQFEQQTLLERAVQGIVQHIGNNSNISLFTNEQTFKNIDANSLKNELLSLGYSHKQLHLNEVLTKAGTLFSGSGNTENHIMVISDFQKRFLEGYGSDSTDAQLHLVKLEHDKKTNVSIDSVYVTGTLNEEMTLRVLVRGLEPGQNMPISLLNGNRLIAKSAVEGTEGKTSELEFSIAAKEPIKGKVWLQDNALGYDNSFYFNVDNQELINVLAIGEADADFLKKIYTEDDFAFSNFRLNELNYSLIEKQNLIILNELEQLPNSLVTVLKAFMDKGGSLLLIPHKEAIPETYNAMLRTMGTIAFQELQNSEQKISSINFEHPVFENVFEKKVTNFDYPEVKSYHSLSTQGSAAIRFTNGSPFLTKQGNVYIFTAAINDLNSNFKVDPLIVPTLYNIAKLSLKLPKLYQFIGAPTNVDIATQLEKDKIVTISGTESEFIPLQKAFSNRLRLTFDNLPQKDGTYAVRNDRDTLQHLSFNYPRTESNLEFPGLETIFQNKVYDNIPMLFKELDDSNSITDYWKWFVIFAIIFALSELLIQKVFA